MLKCSKRNYLYILIFCFGHSKLGTHPQGGESGGPILKIRVCFGFRYSDFGFQLALWLTFTQAHSALLGRFDEFDQRDHLFFGCLTETSIPLLRRKLCPQMGLHWKISLPTNNSARTGEVAAFHQAIGEGNLTAKLGASDFQVAA